MRVWSLKSQSKRRCSVTMSSTMFSIAYICRVGLKIDLQFSERDNAHAADRQSSKFNYCYICVGLSLAFHINYDSRLHLIYDIN